MPKLTGKVAVVTGGNSGIGLATAKRFREEGAQVVISGRDQKTLDEAVTLAATGAKLLAGGMSLIPMMKLRLATPERLVDLVLRAGCVELDGRAVMIEGAVQ